MITALEGRKGDRNDPSPFPAAEFVEDLTVSVAPTIEEENIIEIDQQSLISDPAGVAFMNTLLVQDYCPPAHAATDPVHCAICLCILQSDDTVHFLPCTHVFHVKCIRGWLRKPQKKTCPVCFTLLY